jgi:hypothetical protein
MSIILGIIIGAVTTAVIYEIGDHRRKVKEARIRRHRDLVLAQQQQRKTAADPNISAWSPEAQLAAIIEAIQDKNK